MCKRLAAALRAKRSGVPKTQRAFSPDDRSAMKAIFLKSMIKRIAKDYVMYADWYKDGAWYKEGIVPGAIPGTRRRTWRGSREELEEQRIG